MSFYKGEKTRARGGLELSEEFEVKIGVHQGSVLSPLIFMIVVAVVTGSVRNGLMSELFYADDLVLTSEMIERLREKFWKWKEAFETKRLKVNLSKTNVVVSGAEGEESVSKENQCGINPYLWEASNGKFSIVCEMWEMDQRKMQKSKEGDPEVGKSLYVWKMQEAS